MENLDSILASYLEAYEQHPDMDVDALIKQQMEKHGVSQEGQAMIQEANAFLESTQQQLEAIDTAHRAGISLEEYAQKELDESLAGLDKEKKEAFLGRIASEWEKDNLNSISEEGSHGK